MIKIKFAARITEIFDIDPHDTQIVNSVSEILSNINGKTHPAMHSTILSAVCGKTVDLKKTAKRLNIMGSRNEPGKNYLRLNRFADN